MKSHRAATLRGVVVAGWLDDHSTVDAAADDDDPEVRAAVISAWQRGGRLTTQRLVRALGDDNPTVRRRACECAARVDDPPPELIDRLAGATTDPDHAVVDASCFALGEIAPLHAREAVAARSLEAVATGHGDPLCRESAVAALGAIGDPDSMEVVLAACRDRATVRRRAVLALAAFEGEAVTEMLSVLLDDRDWQVRQAAEDLTAPPVE